MSSREIADLVEKRHDNVKRTIETLADRGVIQFPQSEEISTATKPVTVYRLPKRDTFVVVAQLSPEFTARVVDRWQELEAEKAKGVLALPNFSNPAEAARAWAAEFEAKQKAQALLIEVQPKVEVFKRVVSHDRSITDVARMLDGATGDDSRHHRTPSSPLSVLKPSVTLGGHLQAHWCPSYGDLAEVRSESVAPLPAPLRLPLWRMFWRKVREGSSGKRFLAASPAHSPLLGMIAGDG